MQNKRTLDAFFVSQSKKARVEADNEHSEDDQPAKRARSPTESRCIHHSYPFALPQLPKFVVEGLGFAPSSKPNTVNNAPDLDILYYDHFIPQHIHRELFNFLRSSLFFYRVQYKLKRGSIETEVKTPRFTTVFGLDATSIFSAQGEILDAKTEKAVPHDKYSCTPRPIPSCLDILRVLTENATDQNFNFCLVNYYASGADSISYHSDDERFLGPEPAIASFSLGARRDFCMRHKPVPAVDLTTDMEQAIKVPRKWELKSGDMLLMRGKTQERWLHAVPKRKGGESGLGRINITFRKALVKGGTENYYRYNVGTGAIYKWDEEKAEMRLWKSQEA